MTVTSPPLASAVELGDLLARAQRRGLDAVLSDPNGDAAATRVGAVRMDSRLVEAGDLFVAVPGTRVDGAAYIEEARRRGAAAIVCDRARLPAALPADMPVVLAGDVAAAAGFFASAIWNDPSDSLEVVGVTGTNGKTSSTYLLESVWNAAGRSPGIIGTIVQRCQAFELVSPMTTPSAVELQETLARMLAAGTDSVVMEASSHALDQRRVAGCRFRAGLFTNLTRDHLDYHGTEDSYFAAKASLFRRWLAAGRSAAVLNAEDARVAALAGELGHLDVWTYSTAPGASATATVVSADCTLAGIDAVFDLAGTRVEIRSALVGDANLSNLLAVAAVARATGISADAISAGLSSCPPVPGRMERMYAPAPHGTAVPASEPAVFVDYAHTPDALERSLLALASHRTRSRSHDAHASRIVVVFGCGGDRDRGKRPIMGRIAAELSDVAILTSDNPRSEDPHAILGEIEGGIGARMDRCAPDLLAGPGTRGYLVEADRLRAIETAVALARCGDVVLVAGKGHEDYQDVAGTKRHFDDREIAREMLARRREHNGGAAQPGEGGEGGGNDEVAVERAE